MIIFFRSIIGAIAHNHVSLKRASECDTQLAAVPAASSVITLHTYIKNLYSAKIVKRIRGALAFNSSLQRCSASIRLAVLSRCRAWTLLQLQMALGKKTATLSTLCILSNRFVSCRMICHIKVTAAPQLGDDCAGNRPTSGNATNLIKDCRHRWNAATGRDDASGRAGRRKVRQMYSLPGVSVHRAAPTTIRVTD